MATILIVDDEAPIREILTTLFRVGGHRVVQAANGEQALELLRAGAPDLVIADLMMPLMGGAELCRRIKAGPETAAVPVILMSAAGWVPEGAYGAEGFLAKPFNLDEMERLVEARLAGS